MSFLEDLIDDLKAQKSASEKGEDGKPFPFAKKTDKNGDKDEKRERGEDDDKDEKKDSEKEASTPALFAELLALNPELKKLASLEAETAIMADMKRSELAAKAAAAAQVPAELAAKFAFDERALFDEAFYERTMKIAAADPEYAAIIEAEQTKQAFNEGFAAQIEEIKTAYQIDDATMSQFLAANGLG